MRRKNIKKIDMYKKLLNIRSDSILLNKLLYIYRIENSPRPYKTIDNINFMKALYHVMSKGVMIYGNN